MISTKNLMHAKPGLLCILMVVFSNLAQAVSCHPYIEQLSNGNLKFSVTLTGQQAYVEVFVRKNGIQTVAQNIVSSGVSNGNGTYTYSYTSPASNYASGDVILTRFYSYVAGQPGVFTPGPQESVWAAEFIYNQSCKVVYVSVNGSDTNPGTKTSPVKTITKGVQLAASYGASEVRVAQGNYIDGNIALPNGLDLLGGYSSDFNNRDVTLVNYLTVIDANQPTGFMVCGSARILNLSNITSETIVEGFKMTEGRLCNFGGGIAITNSSDALIVRNNLIEGNAAVGSVSSLGGNVYVSNSAAKIYNNTIIHGFAGTSGHDIYVTGKYQGTVAAQVYNNTFTTEPNVVGLENTVHYGNKYLNQQYVHVSVIGNDANSGTNEAPVKTVAYALVKAATIDASQLRISQGTYVEGNLNVVNGVSIYGGFSTDFSVRSPGSYETKIDAQQPTGFMVCGSKRIFKAENITELTVIDGLTITGGRMCAYGGGINISNSTSSLIIQNNKIIGNSSVGNGSSAGGNIYIENSAVKILNNQITGGFSGGGFGNDIYITGTHTSGILSEIAYNTLTSASSSIYGGGNANVHDNTYLNAKQATNQTSNFYAPLEVRVIDDKIIISGSENEGTDVQIMDMAGRVLVDREGIEIPVSSLSPGIYIIKAETAAAQVTEKVYIK